MDSERRPTEQLDGDVHEAIVQRTETDRVVGHGGRFGLEQLHHRWIQRAEGFGELSLK